MRLLNISASHTRISRHCRSGFAIITVVAMIALVAACLVVLAEVFSYQLQLTTTTIDRLQVDLLLNAGTTCALADLIDGKVPSKPWSVALPTALAKKADNLIITPHREGAGTVFMTVYATVSHLKSQRVLIFKRYAGHWRLVKVRITERTPQTTSVSKK